MDLYRVFGSSKFSRSLFIEHAGDDHGDDFVLSWRERFEALSQGCNFAFSLASRAISVQCDLNRIQQVLVAERLGKELDGSSLHRPHGHRDVTVGANKDNRDIVLSLSQFALKVESAYSRQPNVEDKATGYILALALQKLLGSSEQLHLQSYRLDEPLNRPANRRIVIHYKNNRGRFCHEKPQLLLWQSKLKKRSLEIGLRPQTASVGLYD